MRWSGHELSADGIAAFYDGLIDGLVADERADAVPVLETDVLMGNSEQRRHVAEQALNFSLGLR
jgi:hypothetical protein